MCVSCFGLVVSNCQVIDYRKTPLMTPSWGEEIISTKPRWKKVFVCIFFLFRLVCLCCYLFSHPPDPTQYIFKMPVVRCSLFVLKMVLNTIKPKHLIYICSRGYLQNLVDVLGIGCFGICRPLKYDWSTLSGDRQFDQKDFSQFVWRHRKHLDVSDNSYPKWLLLRLMRWIRQLQICQEFLPDSWPNCRYFGLFCAQQFWVFVQRSYFHFALARKWIYVIYINIIRK